MAKRAFPLSNVYRLLEPGPVVLVTTAGKTNVQDSFLMLPSLADFPPFDVFCVPASRISIRCGSRSVRTLTRGGQLMPHRGTAFRRHTESSCRQTPPA